MLPLAVLEGMAVIDVMNLDEDGVANCSSQGNMAAGVWSQNDLKSGLRWHR